MENNLQKIEVPWGAWFQDRQETFFLPAAWKIDYFDLKRQAPVNERRITEKLQSLISELKERRPHSVVIAVDDLTRPVYLGELLRVLLEILHQSGLKQEQIIFLFGLGTHRPLSEEDMAKKLGTEIVRKYQCLNHHVTETESIGETWGKTDVKINRHYLAADFKIVISGLTPHSFAGFSGGAKMIIPGLADMEIVAKTHKSVMMGFMGKLGEVENNRFRKTIETLVRKAGLDFFIGVVLNGDRTIADIYTGDFIEAHRKAAEAARILYQVNINDHVPYDVILLNAFPKDTELLQAENGFIPLKSAGTNLVKEGGTVILTSACSEGMGHHGLFEPGGKLYHPPRPIRFLKGRRFVFYSPNIVPDEFYKLFHNEYLFFREKDKLEKYLMQSIEGKARAAVFPYASLQMVGN